MHITNIRSLPYCSDSEHLMRALNRLGMPAFLDSASHGGSSGSMDILAAAPIAYIKVERGTLSCSDNVQGLIEECTTVPAILRYIRCLKEKFLPTTNELHKVNRQQHHAGSVIAYLGYPTLSGKAEVTISDAFVGVYLWTLVVDHDKGCCELRVHPDCSNAFIDALFTAIEESIFGVAATEVAEFSLQSPIKSEISYSEYSTAFNDIKSRIANGECYQVNLTQSFTASGSGDPLSAYLKLRKATTAPFSAYINWASGALLSLSPERFVSVEQGHVLTQPIKGTRPRGESGSADQRLARELEGSEKDRAENLMIVDLMRNDLGRVCEVGSIEVNQLFAIESFSNVHHMVSDIAGKLRVGKDALDLLASCYPGGSITGAPKLSAMKIIQEVERDARRVYCGTVLNLGATGSLDSNITIRSLLWERGVLRCWAGGGIVADSDCEQEYQECFDKINNIFSVLQDLP